MHAAVELGHRAKRLATSIGNPTTLAWAEYALGEALLDQEPDRAREAVDRALVAARAARNRFVVGVSQVSAASLHARHGDARQALHLFDEAVDYWSQAGNWIQQWITLRNVIDLLIRLKADESAAVIYGALTRERHRDIGLRSGRRAADRTRRRPAVAPGRRRVHRRPRTRQGAG